MAKTLNANFGELDAGERTFAGKPVIFDGAEAGWRELNRNHSWLLANRVKTRHVNQWWPAGASGLRETGSGAYSDRLNFRITPRRHVVRLKVWANCDTDGANGKMRVSIGATNLDFNFAGAHSVLNVQTGTIAVTGGTPPTTDLVVVRFDADLSTFIDLRWLYIRDDALVLGDLP